MGFEDTFKKQIDELGKALARLLTGLLGFKSQGKIEQGVEFVQQNFHSESGLDFNDLLAIPPDDLADFLNRKHNITNENIDKFAEIFYEMADGIEPTDMNKARIFFERSLALHEYLSRTDATYSLERHFIIEEIKSVLKTNS
jgi:hypothetical protein